MKGEPEVRTIAIANQKGGVGKTSTAVYLAASLARAGLSVLLVDLDPQASLTEYFLDPANLEQTMYHLLIDGEPIKPLRLGEYISLLPANIDLAAAEVLLPAKTNHEKRLAKFLKTYSYDFCLIDCPPSLGVLTRNALTAAKRVIIPVSTEKMAERTVKLIMDTIDDVVDSELNETLKVWRILPTRFDIRERESSETLAELKAKHGSLVYSEPVHERTKYKKAVRQQLDINDLDTELGQYWDRLAATLIAESEVI
jgi:chromosome partitioning protein